MIICFMERMNRQHGATPGPAYRAGNVSAMAALVLAGLSAGFFYTWSVTVMNGFDAADPHVAIKAMQAVNAHIRNAWFGAVFFGAPTSILVAALMLAVSGRRKAALLAGAGFILATVVVTITFTLHVPWNEALAAAAIPPERDAAAAMWQDYSAKWTAWNHARAAAGILAFGCMALALKSISEPTSQA